MNSINFASDTETATEVITSEETTTIDIIDINRDDDITGINQHFISPLGDFPYTQSLVRSPKIPLLPFIFSKKKIIS